MKYTTLHLVDISPYINLHFDIFLDFPVFDYLDRLENIAQVFWRMPLYRNLSDVFLMIAQCLWVWEKMITEVKCYLHHIISRVHTINMIYECY